MKRISLGIDESLLSKVDHLRGDIPRERYLRRIIEDRVLDRGRQIATNGQDYPSGDSDSDEATSDDDEEGETTPIHIKIRHKGEIQTVESPEGREVVRKVLKAEMPHKFISLGEGRKYCAMAGCGKRYDDQIHQVDE